MSELPSGWAEARFGDLLSALLDFRGRTPKKLGMQWGGTIPALSSLNVRQGHLDLSRTSHFGSLELYERWMTTGDPEKGDIVLTMEAPLGNVAQIPDGERYILSQRVVLLKTRPGIEAGFLAHQMRAPEFRKRLLAGATGTTATGISQARLVELRATVAPLAEQKRIAHKLDALIARVNTCRGGLDRVPEILRRLRLSILAAATSGGLTREWREERRLDGEWPVVDLESVATDFSYGSGAKSSKVGKVPVLRMGNIQNGLLDWQDLVFTSDAAEIAKYKLSEGDVLFNRTNSPELVGKAAVFRGERPAVYAGYLIRVKCGERLLPDYLNYCLGSPAGREYCWHVKSDSVSQSNINARKLAAFTFGLPGLEEQQEIVRRVEKLLALNGMIAARSQRTAMQVEQLIQSMLSKAFRGELVPNEVELAVEEDRDPETASVLLRHIQEARGHHISAKRGRGGKKVGRRTSLKQGKTRRPLDDVLREQDVPLRPERLFDLAGFDENSVDEFYEQLRRLLEERRVRENRPNSTDVTIEVVRR